MNVKAPAQGAEVASAQGVCAEAELRGSQPKVQAQSWAPLVLPLTLRGPASLLSLSQ